MKQFSLEEYIKNPSRKIVTRDGRVVTRILCTDAKGDYPIVALVEKPNLQKDDAFTYTKDGRCLDNETNDERDLFFAPKKREGWVNIYRDDIFGELYCGDKIYTSEEEAKRDAIAEAAYTTIKIEWEE